MLRSTEYFKLLVRRTLDRVLDALLADPRRVFGLESVFFPDMYWNARPEMRDTFRMLVEDGRLTFSGCGVTTPDTLLPSDEMLLRDLLIGQEWLRSRRMTVEPRTLYLPDSFGHSPGLPAVLTAAGVDNVAFHRIDGMFFPGGETDRRDGFPRPGSTASLLTDVTGPDVVWRAPDGSEVLAHWVANGYGYGDMIASRGFTRTLQLPLSFPSHDRALSDSRIRRCADELSRTARTPYMLLTIGHDFVNPVPNLIGVIDGWNERHYDRTGLWLVNASMDSYFSLLRSHRHELPVVDLDPNPCWTGFYSSRPDLKEAARSLEASLLVHDQRVAREAIASGEIAPIERSPEAWWIGVSSNHHDFITGTSGNHVALGEQQPWLARAAESLDTAFSPPTIHDRPGGSVGVTRSGTITTVELPWATAIFDADRGGTLVSLTDRSGTELVDRSALELRSHHDSGGLWRMGCEFRGGRWAMVDKTGERHARVLVRADDDSATIVVIVDTTLEGRPATVRTFLSLTDPRIFVETVVSAPIRRTVTISFPSSEKAECIEMHQPGGLVTRPLQRHYDPTFWPLHSFAHVLNRNDQLREPVTGPAPTRLSIAVAAPTALHVDEDGRVDVVVARTPFKELAHGIRPILAPVWGGRWPSQHATVAFGWTPVPGPEDTERHRPAGLDLHHAVRSRAGIPAPRWLVNSDDPLIETIAVKPADRGAGTIVRLRSWGPSGQPRETAVSLDPSLGHRIVAAQLIDARERDLEPLPVSGGAVDMLITNHLTTLRIETSGHTDDNSP